MMLKLYITLTLSIYANTLPNTEVSCLLKAGDKTLMINHIHTHTGDVHTDFPVPYGYKPEDLTVTCEKGIK